MKTLLVLAAATLALPAQAAPTNADARQVVERYYAAIERGDFPAAWRAWSPTRAGTGANGQTYAQFVRGYAGTRHTSVVAGPPTDGDAGAGSIYVTVPVEVRAVTKSGERQRFVGRYVLRRINGVDGATPWQLGWHFASASLRRVPAR